MKIFINSKVNSIEQIKSINFNVRELISKILLFCVENGYGSVLNNSCGTFYINSYTKNYIHAIKKLIYLIDGSTICLSKFLF